MLCVHLGPGKVVDNLAAHKVKGIRAAIEATGARSLYLPLYSPDLDPIEKAYSKVKTHLRRLGLRIVEVLCDGVGDASASITAQDCRGYDESCGHVFSDNYLG